MAAADGAVEPGAAEGAVDAVDAVAVKLRFVGWSWRAVAVAATACDFAASSCPVEVEPTADRPGSLPT